MFRSVLASRWRRTGPDRPGEQHRHGTWGITARSAAGLAAAACLVVLAAGCASHGNAPGAGATRSPGASRTAAPSAAARTPAAAAPAAAARGGQAAAPRCHTSQLSVAFTGLNAAMGGVRGTTLILTNRSGATCSVYGYPGLAFATSGGVLMATHLTWVKQPRAIVVLRPGGNAQAMLTWRVNVDAPTAFSPDIVHITPPDEYTSLRAGWEGGPVPGGAITAWPLRAAPAGPFPGGTGTIANPFNGMCVTLAAGRHRRGGLDMQPRHQHPAVDQLQRRHAADRRQVPGRHRPRGRRQGQGRGVHRGAQPEMGDRPGVLQ